MARSAPSWSRDHAVINLIADQMMGRFDYGRQYSEWARRTAEEEEEEEETDGS